MYKSLDVLNSGGGVVPNSVVYKYSDPLSARVCLLMKLHRLKKRRASATLYLSLSQQRISRFLVFSPSVPHSLLRLRFTFPRRRFMVLHSLRLYGTLLLLSAPSRVGLLISWVMDFSDRGGNIFIQYESKLSLVPFVRFVKNDNSID